VAGKVDLRNKSKKMGRIKGGRDWRIWRRDFWLCDLNSAFPYRENKDYFSCDRESTETILLLNPDLVSETAFKCRLFYVRSPATPFTRLLGPHSIQTAFDFHLDVKLSHLAKHLNIV
jgi:hypothetical protein